MADINNKTDKLRGSIVTVFWRHLVYYLKPELLLAWPLIIYAALVGIFSLAVPLTVQIMVNTISFESLAQPLAVLALLLIGALTFSAVLEAFQDFYVEQISQRLYVRWFSELTLRIKFIDKNPELIKNPIALANKFLDLVTIQKALSGIFLEGTGIALQSIVGFLILAFYHPFLLAFCGFLLSSVFIIIFLAGRKAVEGNMKVSNVKYKTLEWLQNLMDRSSLKTSNLSWQSVSSESAMLIDEHLSYRRSYFRIIFSQNIGMLLIQVLAPVLLLGIGGLMVIKNQLTLGQLVASELIVSMLIYGIMKINKLLIYVYDLMVALGKFEKLLHFNIEMPKEIIKSENADPQFLDKMSEQIMLKERNYFEDFGLNSLVNYFSPLNAFRNLAFFILFLLVATFTALFLPWQQTSFGYGKVIAFSPQDRVQLVTSPVEGKILKWHVVEGSIVKEGDTIVEMIDNDPDFVLRLNQEKIALVQRLNSASQSKKMSRLNLDRQAILYKKGISSKRVLEQAQMELNRLEADEASAQAELSRLAVRMSRQDSQLIKAPRAGTIFRVLQGEGGLFVKSGEPLASIIPESTNRSAELWVSASDLPLLREGQTVRLQFDGWPALQFSGWPSLAVGTFAGKIILIDQSSNLKGKFRIIVQQSGSQNWPKAEYLRQGVLAQGWVLLSQVSIGFELWRLFNGFPPAYYNEISANDPGLLQSDDFKAEKKK